MLRRWEMCPNFEPFWDFYPTYWCTGVKEYPGDVRILHLSVALRRG